MNLDRTPKTSHINLKNKFIFHSFSVTVLLLASFYTNLYSEEQSYSLPVDVVFKKVSHQNPWQIREPIRKTSQAIRIGEGIFFTMTLPNEKPIFAELDRSGEPNARLVIHRYDSSTGFIILKAEENYGMTKVIINPQTSAKICGLGNYEYLKFSFSMVPLRFYRMAESVDDYLVKKNILCGIQNGKYLIPAEYISFIANASNDNFQIPHPGFEFESALTSSERTYHFPNKRKGIVVSKVYPGVGPAFHLLPGDAIYQINGVNLDKFPDYLVGDRALDSLLRKSSSLRSVGSTVEIKYFRNGVDSKLSYKLNPFHDKDFLVPETHPYSSPPYLIAGGLFFTELTSAYLKEFGEDYRRNSEKKLLYILESFQTKTHPHRQRVVILSRVLPDDKNQGYQEFQDLIVNRVNGMNVFNLKELKKILRNSNEEFVRIEFSGGKEVVFRRSTLNAVDENILRNYKLNSLDNLGED
ncbi:PDZ domain-containing protein [Leptospira sp. GIMC2001]|uniref:PDZ domain-containing protein n=1 Tax=Leptospira sp. GIMC2001 TaxID=1513297 RepID=UPI00234A244D|nr:PDZ domain-containing protein [Leptospira sp. GIMC2001]WCL48778.1 PDZ domain-containing protein [Leptospira sp. GIMC2001]